MHRRLRSIANHPVAIVVLLAYFTGDLICLTLREYLERSFTGHAINSAAGRGRPRGMVVPYATVMRRPDGTHVLVDEWTPNPPAGGTDGWQTVDEIRLIVRDYHRGLYAPTWIEHPRSMRGPSIMMSAAELNALRSAGVDMMLAAGWLDGFELAHARTELISGRSINRWTLLPLGYLHNTLSLAMFLMLLWSLRLNVPKLLRRRDPTRCPHCNYSTVGLPTTTCPECGHTPAA